MGELDEGEFLIDAEHDHAEQPEHAAPEPQRWRVRARKPLTPEAVAAECEPGSVDAARVLDLHESMKQRARLYAAHLERLATFFREDPDVQGVIDEADIIAAKIATGLRCTCRQAQSQVLDAHRAVEWMPRTFENLRTGDLPEAWHQHLLRQIRRLEEHQVRSLDAHLAGVELASVSKTTFERQLKYGIALATAGTLPTPPSESRNVEIVDVNTETGVASLFVSGPIPEITALAHRLDVAARTVQKAQRAALESDAEGPLPFDIDEDLAARGRAHSLATLRYAILTHSLLDLDPVEETRKPYKLLVTVPVTTMLGLDDAPAMLEGMTPIPAQQARELAAGERTWTRILTDPITGAHLPVTAESYSPPQQMRLQLRLRHPVCAVPGCDRRTAIAAEDDHLIEYDHDHPDQGGQTSLWNLHRLCWAHHAQKTAGLIDPSRDPRDDPARGDGTTPAGPWETTWDLGDSVLTRSHEHTDLATPHMVEALQRAWRTSQRHHEDAVRLHEQEKARPVEERVAEDRALATRKAYPGRSGSRDARRIIPPGASQEEVAPPF
ncbi:HNH endonuclease signature motif containing protein [Brachybacterium sp.]|uniref:HNH endonuclease signature motif containing protein n=1 Tax=Brachybacterium sp. TaxID=1891286 RepID=UPI002ED1A4F6